MTHNHIDADRRSAVSSFYGGHRSSADMLNSENVVQMGPPSGARVMTPRHDQDDSSSFYGSQRDARPSADVLMSGSAGYNRASFFDAGRVAPVKGVLDEEDAAFLDAKSGAVKDEEAGWDVFADFNNAGMRYSSMLGHNLDVQYNPVNEKQDTSYRRIPDSARLPSKNEMDSSMSTSGAPVELVTVPKLGGEWKKQELEAMTKKGRRRQKDSHAWSDFRAWTRDQRGICGKWGTRLQVVISLFIICVLVGIALVFTLPRVPTINFMSSSPLLNSTGPPNTTFSRSPANFSFAAKLDLQFDTNANFLPLRFSNINTKIYDLSSGFLVGTGNDSMTIPAKRYQEVQVPLNFTYIATNDSDATWLSWYNACKNSALYPDGHRPGLNFRVVLDLAIAGLIGTRTVSTQISNVQCPVELPQNAA